MGRITSLKIFKGSAQKKNFNCGKYINIYNLPF